MFWSTIIVKCISFGTIQILIWVSNNKEPLKMKVDAQSSIWSSYSNTQYCIFIDLLTLLCSHMSGVLLKVLKLSLRKNNTLGISPRRSSDRQQNLVFWHIIWQTWFMYLLLFLFIFAVRATQTHKEIPLFCFIIIFIFFQIHCPVVFLVIVQQITKFTVWIIFQFLSHGSDSFSDQQDKKYFNITCFPFIV